MKQAQIVIKKIIPDNFVLILLATILLASFLPVKGQAAYWAGHMASAAIFTLFFFHGLKLPRDEIAKALGHWRLQLLIFLWVFAVMPVFGFALGYLGGDFLPIGLVTGIIYLGFLPSTVQSAISYASIARGNIAASVMASALLNVAAIVIVPLMVAIFIKHGMGGAMEMDIVLKIVIILLLPFLLGQIAQRWWYDWAQRQKKLISIMDKGVIALAVYVAFSSAVAAGLWQTVSPDKLVILCLFIMVFLALAFGGTWALGRGPIGRWAGLNHGDRVTLLFTGAQKSIATGAPLAALLFPGPEAGMVILPALVYHQCQLILSAPIAHKLAHSGE